MFPRNSFATLTPIDDSTVPIVWFPVVQPISDGGSSCFLLIGHLQRNKWPFVYTCSVALIQTQPAPASARAKALDAAGFFVGKQGDYRLAQRYHEESLAISQQSGDQSGIARALHGLGTLR